MLGAGWVLWLLVGLSVLSVTVMLERGLYFGQRRMSKRFPALLRLCQDGARDKAAHPAAAAGASTVMAGISEALVATAIGLFVAIPAVLAYNIYQRLLKRVVGRSQSLGNAIAAGLHVARSNGKGA